MTTQTGPAKAALIAAIGGDCDRICGKLDELRKEAETLRGDFAGLNGTSSFWAGFALRMADEMKAIEKDRGELTAKLSGAGKLTLETAVDTDLAERAKAAREEVA